MITSCLLYTSDAADERSSVDLGGRRIIKKKTQKDNAGWRIVNYKEVKQEQIEISGEKVTNKKRRPKMD